MDSTETLKEIRELVDADTEPVSVGRDQEYEDHVRLVELIRTLDNELCSGGSMPANWLQVGRMTDAQGLALARLLRNYKDEGARLSFGAAGLPESYLHVVLSPSGFECGIDPEGRVSS